MSNVVIKDLSVSFGSVNVLQSLNLDIQAGEFVVLLGPSGCGKSTLLNSIAGLGKVSSGELWIGGNDVTWSEPSERGIGMVFQSYALYPNMSVRGNLSFGLKMAGVKKDEIEKRISRASRILQIENLLQRRPSELSGGQRQRVAIGRALVRDVDVFLFDEPLSNLDAKLRNELRIEIKQLHNELGATMIFVTHDQVEAMTLADRVVLLNRGFVQQIDTPDIIYRKPANIFVASFIGSPTMNFLRGRLSSEGGKAIFVGASGIKLDVSACELARPIKQNEEVTLGFRPEQCYFEPHPESCKLTADITLIEVMGIERTGFGKVGEEKIAVRSLGGDSQLATGRLDVYFDASEASLFDVSGDRI